MLFESANIFFLTKEPDQHKDLSLLLKEYNADIRFITRTFKKNDERCDLLIIETWSFSNQQIEMVLEVCAPDKRAIPVIFLIKEGQETKIMSLLESHRVAVIKIPLVHEKVRKLLDLLFENVAQRHKALEEHQSYEALLENSIVTKTDPEGIITFANENFCRLSGYTQEELLGKDHNIIRHPDMPDESFKELWETILQKKVWAGKVKNLKKDGGYYIANSMIIPILDNHGNIREFMAIRNDETQVEEMRQRIADEKELQSQFKHKQEMLEEVNRAKDEFLVVFTHELKTPLNAIINFSEYISKQLQKCDIEKKERLLELIVSVRKNAGNMLENIINIIDISKLKAGKLTLHPTHVNLHELISDLEQRFTPLMEESTVDVIYKVAKDCTVKIDERRLNQVLGNILSNAIKYGKGKVLVEAECLEDAFEITVEDNGPGIKDVTKIFDLYEQGDEDKVTRTAQGTGVGLHFVKYLCREMKIDIKVEKSKHLGGARFVLRGKIR